MCVHVSVQVAGYRVHACVRVAVCVYGMVWRVRMVCLAAWNECMYVMRCDARFGSVVPSDVRFWHGMVWYGVCVYVCRAVALCLVLPAGLARNG